MITAAPIMTMNRRRKADDVLSATISKVAKKRKKGAAPVPAKYRTAAKTAAKHKGGRSPPKVKEKRVVSLDEIFGTTAPRRKTLNSYLDEAILQEDIERENLRKEHQQKLEKERQTTAPLGNYVACSEPFIAHVLC